MDEGGPARPPSPFTEDRLRPLIDVLTEYRDAARGFSRPARTYLVAAFLTWMGHGFSQVLFNLYLVEGGFDADFVGRVVAFNGFGIAVAALPAGLIANRFGRQRCLVAGAVIEGVAMLVRACTLDPALVTAFAFAHGAGQALLAIAASPFLTEHSHDRERTHLFSAFFTTSLLAAVAGSLIAGSLPGALRALRPLEVGDWLAAYRITLVAGAAVAAAAALPLLRLGWLDETRHDRAAAAAVPPELRRRLVPIAINALLIGAGAGLVIPFMNLYFQQRFDCSSAQIGLFFAVAQVTTALAAILGPAVARRFGNLRTATAMELMSLPFLVTLGFERHLHVAVGAFWLRATLMQAGTPLIGAFVMQVLPAPLRAVSQSVNNTLWHVGWATSAALAGWMIHRFGFAVPFYVTAALYATAAVTFWRAFRAHANDGIEPPPPRETVVDDAMAATERAIGP